MVEVVWSVGEEKRNILILGCGFGGLYTALYLQKILKKDDRYAIVMVSNENFFLFTPLLHKVASGAVETRHITYPIRRLRRHSNFHFHQKEIQSIDLQTRKVTTDSGILNYEYLVLALGGITDTLRLPSFEKNVCVLKTLFDGIVLRNQIIRMFELADIEPRREEQSHLLTFVVAGSGYTGVQLIAEIDDFIRGSLVKGYRRINPALIKIILVEDEDRIMGEMKKKLAFTAEAYLKSQGIEVLLNSSVTKICENAIEINGKRTIFTHTLVWVTGVLANPIIAQLPAKKDDRGRVKVNEYFQVPGYPKVYAVGDNACFLNHETGEALPLRAHFATRQAKRLAGNIWADIKGIPEKPFRSGSNPAIVFLGSRNAIADVYGLHFHGFFIRFMGLIGYIFLMKGFLNRIRVTTDWFFNFLFGRDTTLLKVEKSRPWVSPDKRL
ncbi:MAG: NAD(P)/FAD-dependent oxidoreductase [Candidatus Mariimomonas ferrooxydans]